MSADPQTLLDAALAYAARGWPVFPCNPKNKQPLLASDKDEGGKPIKGTGGVSKATTDAAQIKVWWKRWPKALIGLATGHPTIDAGGKRLFVVDFDPRTDDSTGEVWDLPRLKGETEAQIGCALPESQAALTPSDGVHLYLLQDAGDPINNRGNLPTHVDVRGLGGYVIAPPSVMAADAIKGQGNRRYRWFRRGGIADAPPQLLAVLRERKGKPAPATDQAPPREPIDRAAAPSIDDAVRRYAIAGLDSELQAVRTSPSGQRNLQLFQSASKIASLVAARALDGSMARGMLEAAARDNPGNDDDRQLIATIDSGWDRGLAEPRDLREVEAKARDRADRASRAGPSARAGGGDQSRPFRPGSMERVSDAGGQGRRELTPVDIERLERIATVWLTSKLQAADRTPDAFKAIAWGIGRRAAAQLLDERAAKTLLWEAGSDVAGLTHADVDQAIEEGRLKGFDPRGLLRDLECSRYPLTDFGIAERFRDRFGHEFRFTTAKGWLGWDGRRWKVLDQDEKTPPAEVIAAVFDTVRAIQGEAKAVRGTGTKWELITYFGPRGGERQRIATEHDQDPNPHALDYWTPKGAGFVLHSESLAAFGRLAESAGKPSAIAALARRWLTVPIEGFDCELMAINVLNGTLRFNVETMPDGTRQVGVRLDRHRRRDLITRLAPVEYDHAATAPLYDAMIAWAQPDPAMRRYVEQVGGYACTGDTGQHLLWFNYGRGRNGKSVTIDSWCAALGDYSGTIGIESFLDQGIKKRGDAATPDLAKLGGVRLLRASEPERGAKLNSALIKAATGGEPMSVRALHRGFFDLQPRFKLLMSGNSKPSIPDTDEGIWGRMKLVPWLRHIERPLEDPYAADFPCADWPQKDPQLGAKIKAQELPGVFRRLMDGLVDFLAHGFIEPERVTVATADYRNQSDPLARFLALCTEAEAGSRVKSSDLHAVFAAWCRAAGEKEWSQKGFSDALIDKGFTKTRSDGMRWEGLKLVRQVSDFIDEEGRVRLISDDLSREPPTMASDPDPAPAATARPFRDDDRDIPY